jgi:hypothetical protein
MRSCAEPLIRLDRRDPFVEALASRLPRGQAKAIVGEMRGFRKPGVERARQFDLFGGEAKP